MHRNAAKLTAGGRPASWLGVNFWSRTGGPLMWRNYDPEVIRAELRRAARARAVHDPVVLLLARFHAGSRTASTSR